MSTGDAMAALVERLKAQLPARVGVFDIHDVPPARPAEYVTVLLIRRPGGPRNMGASTGVTGYRVRVRASSNASASNVRNTLDRCRTALEFRPLTVGTGLTTPPQFETEDDITEDGGWFAAYDDYTFAL